MQKTRVFHVNGMHCSACVILIESELKEIAEVGHVKASLSHLSVEVSGDFGDKSAEHIARDLSEILKPHGYSLTPERQKYLPRWHEFKIALPVAGVFIVIFLALQKIGILDFVQASEVNYSTAFVIGLVASISTCMAVVGGLVLSISANFAKEGDRVKPQILFHVGRLISFFILGGAIGLVGSVFQFGSLGVFILSLIVGLVMLILGLNLLDVFPRIKKFQPVMPSFIAKRTHGLKNLNHTLTPFLIGAATFFLPCGFTQSMQIYTLTTGSFLTGALNMFIFALGTFPALALLSFSSFSIHNKSKSGVFFKTVGLIVIFFGVFNLLNSLVAIALIPPIFNF